MEDTPGQTKPVYNFYKDSLNDVLDSNIDDTLASTINTNLCPLRQTTSAIQLGMPFDIPLPLGLFSEAASGEDKNSSPLAKRSLSPTLPTYNVPREPSYRLLRPSRKRKPKATLMFWGLEDSGIITDQSRSQGASLLSKSNANSMESFVAEPNAKGLKRCSRVKGRCRVRCIPKKAEMGELYDR